MSTLAEIDIGEGGVGRVAIQSSGAGTFDLIAAVAGKKQRITALKYNASVACTVQFFSWDGAVATALTGDMTESAVAGTPETLPYHPEGWMETLDGQGLRMVVTGAANVRGILTYKLVD